MFRRIRLITETVHLDFEGQTIEADAADSLAAALVAAGILDFRESMLDGSPRGPHCLIGNCFDCLLEVDGQANVQSCREPVRSGMRVRRQRREEEILHDET